jgi:ribonuclease R
MREFPSSHEILKFFEESPEKTFRLRELVVKLGLRSSQARELKQALRELVRNRKIVYLKKNHFALIHKSRQAAGAKLLSRRVAEGAPHGAISPRPSPRGNMVRGRLIGHRDGYGFVVPDAPLPETDLDIFIPPDGMSSAMHGDRVEVHAVRSRRGGRPEAGGRLEGRVLRVLERAQKTVVGEFRCGERSNYVLPFDQRLPFEIAIPRGQEWPALGREVSRRDRQFGGESEGARGQAAAGAPRSPRELEGLIVDVEITDYPQPGRRDNARGRVIEILGRRDEFGVDVEIMVRKYHLPHRFPPQVLAEASDTPQFISEAEREGRRDFRSFPIVTIDGETAKDFDDAVYVERCRGAYLLHVHIADVAHYVRPGTALDREARLRGTSVYFPDRAVPMLPLDLSNGICSLNPRVDRLTLSVRMEIDAQGHIVEYELVPGIIHSAERMTYTAVRDILAGEAAACERYAPLVGEFKLMEELALVLNRQRDQRGSIDFDLPEAEIEFDEHGRMIGVTRSERNIAHRIIEEFMLAANETVAEYLEGKDVPALYRVHEKPDPKKVLQFEEIAASFGYSLGITLPSRPRLRIQARDERDRYARFYEHEDAVELQITSRHYQRLTQRIAGKPEERILSYLMLRSLKQARYSEENVGHFALAAPKYLHFTSPIRRYPDLIVHRILKAVLEKEGGSARVKHEGAELPEGLRAQGGAGLGPCHRRAAPGLGLRHGSAGGAFVNPEELHALGLETSEAERRAQDAERELMEWKKVSFMAGRLGDEFDALIISLTKYGFFVELTDLFVEGFVPLASLEDDRYLYRERLRAIVGQHSKKTYHLGGRVRVRLDRIDRSGNKLEFSVAE